MYLQGVLHRSTENFHVHMNAKDAIYVIFYSVYEKLRPQKGIPGGAGCQQNVNFTKKCSDS